MNKQETIKYLDEKGYETEGLDWNELRSLKKESDIPKLGSVTQKHVDEKVERIMSSSEKNKIRMDEIRKELLPKIKEFIKSMKGRTQLNQAEMSEMYALYNKYFERNDSSRCGVCIARIYNTLKGL